MFRLISALFLSLSLFAGAAQASIDTWTFDNPVQEQRYRTLIDELRCPKCAGQSIGGSDAPIANDLRKVIYRQLQSGASDQQIVDFMVERYGEFVLFRPKASGKTLWLWLGPVIFGLIGMAVLAFIVVRSRRVARNHSDPLSEEERRRVRELLGDELPEEGRKL